MKTVNVSLVGVGGQGIILTADILAKTAALAGRRRDALLERHHRERAAPAVADEAQIDDLAVHLHELKVAPVGLQPGAELLQLCLYLIFHRSFPPSNRWSTGLCWWWGKDSNLGRR